MNDLLSLKEVFVDEEYKLQTSIEPKVILDLGAHIGDSALYHARAFPSAKIIAVEASPKTYKQLEENMKMISNVHCLHAAVSSTTGEISFYEQPDSWGSAVVDRQKSGLQVQVPSYTIRDILKLYGYEKASIVKFDIEGAESSVFNDEDTKSWSDAYIGEVHLDLGVSSVDDFAHQFKDFKVSFREISSDRRYIMSAL